jgi:hypothetical protein
MSDPDAATDGVATDGRDALPTHTTPTWEMELLVSGATIFGLLQVPHLLDSMYFKLVNLSPQAYAAWLMPLFLYAKVAVVTLVLTFLAHLCLRGYWVALVGMDSVYPGGILWDRMRLGPISRARFEAMTGSMASVIERADNRATRVFGIGFGFASLMVMLTALLVVSLLAALFVDAVFGEGYTNLVLGGVLALIILPWAFASLVDRKYGDRFRAGGRGSRMVAAVLTPYGKLGMGPRSNPLISLFASHAGRLRFAVTALLVIIPVTLALSFQNSAARNHLPLGLYVGITADNPFSADTSPSGFYADARGDGEGVVPLPFIPSRVVATPYLPVFVPFIPRLHGAALRQACPDALRVGDAGERPRLDCLARMLDLRLDDRPVSVRVDATSDPASGQPGVLAMLPIAALPPGRHELSLNEPDRRALDGAPLRRYRIAFWK